MMSAPAPATRYRLVGIGRLTKGLVHLLEPGHPIVIGRHPDCTIVVSRTPEDGATTGYVSRQHAVIEEHPEHGWCIHDSGSVNGTAVLRGGLPPAVTLAAGTPHRLRPDDVIELAGSEEFQFAYQAAPTEEVKPDPAVAGRTERLIALARPTLQLLRGGGAVEAIEVDEEGVVVGRPRSMEGAEGLALARADAAGQVYVKVTLQREHAVLHVQKEGVRRNLERVAPPHSLALGDKDLLTFADAPDVSVLFLDPRQLRERNLSDLLGDAERITIGTAASNSCRLVDPSLSRSHAEIWRENGELFVRDLNSKNGTSVDGRRVFDSERLGRGSRVMLGRLPFVADAGCWDSREAGPPAIDVRFVGVSVEIAGKRRLHEVSLGVGHGQLVGLLGPSASGKSTLLKALAGEHRIVGGEVYVNGRAMRQNQGRWNWFTSLMGYRGEAYEVGFVQQIDLIQPDLTVREILEYAARHMGLDSGHAQRRANEAGEVCNLGPLMDRVAVLGNGRMNLSGGQLKRVCVAIEVLRQPRILLLDEPTTGQDPKNTDDLMNLFRSLAQRGVTLLMSTHDLRRLVVFDRVAALCLGHLVYYGPPTSFAQYFGAATAEDVYASLPDREERTAEAEALASRFRQTPLYRQYCEAAE
jgi:ABC-type multidrug transport system ATPase subunit/pSer/pThr/pTyr-binding forkhead associated (FHA) protein